MTTYEPSRKDIVVGVVFCFSSLVAFALSFTVLEPDGRPILFTVLVVICLACFLIADNKKGVLLGGAAFLLVRVVWALLVTRR